MFYHILTIEDDLLIAEDLKLKLTQLGYHVLGNATNSEEAIQLGKQKSPDLIIADIMIEGAKDGIETISEIYKYHPCPVIYLTANSESALVKRALATHPAAFLIKPFKMSEFSINIDLAIENFRRRLPGTPPNPAPADSIFVPDKFLHQRVYKSDILYVEADGSYIWIVTYDKKYQITTNLKSFELQFNNSDFYRVSRKHLINIEKVNRINGNVLYLKGNKEEYPITISKPQRTEILSRFEIIRTKA